MTTPLSCPPCSLLSESLGMALPSTILFDYPSVEALCGYILAAQVRCVHIVCRVGLGLAVIGPTCQNAPGVPF